MCDKWRSIGRAGRGVWGLAVLRADLWHPRSGLPRGSFGGLLLLLLLLPLLPPPPPPPPPLLFLGGARHAPAASASRSWRGPITPPAAAKPRYLSPAHPPLMQLPSVWKPLQLLGATAGAVIACVLPGCLALSLVHWRLWSGAGAGGVLLIALGLVLAVAGIASVALH